MVRCDVWTRRGPAASGPMSPGLLRHHAKLTMLPNLLVAFALAACIVDGLKFEVDRVDLETDVAKMRLKTGPYPYPNNVRHWYGKPYNMQAQSMENGIVKIMHVSFRQPSRCCAF